jgi:hypothetical protein
MAIDYTAAIATAQRLIGENGRSVTLVEFNRTPANVAEPWKGAADPRAVPDSTLVVDAVFVEPSSATKLGLALVDSDLVKRSDQIMIVSPGAAVDLSVFQEVLDTSVRWKITAIEVLKPGASVVLAYIGVRR